MGLRLEFAYQINGKVVIIFVVDVAGYIIIYIDVDIIVVGQRCSFPSRLGFIEQVSDKGGHHLCRKCHNDHRRQLHLRQHKHREARDE